MALKICRLQMIPLLILLHDNGKSGTIWIQFFLILFQFFLIMDRMLTIDCTFLDLSVGDQSAAHDLKTCKHSSRSSFRVFLSCMRVHLIL